MDLRTNRLIAASGLCAAAAGTIVIGVQINHPPSDLEHVLNGGPAYVQDFVDAAVGRSPAGDLGHMSSLLTVMGLGYSIGGLLFGIALFRSGTSVRWASALFAHGTVSALALAALPEPFSRPFAVPTGIALIGLGVSLWRDQRNQAVTAHTLAAAPVAAPAAR